MFQIIFNSISATFSISPVELKKQKRTKLVRFNTLYGLKEYQSFNLCGGCLDYPRGLSSLGGRGSNTFRESLNFPVRWSTSISFT